MCGAWGVGRAGTKTLIVDGGELGAWRGGSMLGSMPGFKGLCFTKEDYFEQGVAQLEHHLSF